jgi:hypothetical protein
MNRFQLFLFAFKHSRKQFTDSKIAYLLEFLFLVIWIISCIYDIFKGDYWSILAFVLMLFLLVSQIQESFKNLPFFLPTRIFYISLVLNVVSLIYLYFQYK